MKPTTVEGTLSRITFNRDNYFIGKLDTGIGVKGNMLSPQVGMSYKFTGYIITDPKWGDTLKFDSFETSYPTGMGGIRLYLAENCDWIGLEISKRLVNTYGKDTLQICKEDPDRIAREIRGLTLDRAERVSEMLVANEKREVLQIAMNELFQGVRISKRTLNTIMDEYGSKAPELIRANPYSLIEEVRGFGFKTADAVAMKAGYAVDGMPRIRAAIRFVLESEAHGFGHTAMPRGVLVGKVSNLLSSQVPRDKLQEGIEFGIKAGKEIDKDDLISINTLFDKELDVARRLKALLKAKPRYTPYVEDYTTTNAEGETVPLAEDQRAAVDKMVESNVFILTGAPGVGKTASIQCIINSFPAGALVALAAPTGKAAKRMYELCKSEASTIHRLLKPEKVKDGFRFTHNEKNTLSDDVVIIDEASMVNINLMHSLMRALTPGTRLILIGDVYQLPAIGPGNILKDCIHSCEIPCVELTTIKRQDPGLITRNCHRIKAGKNILVENSNHDGDFFFVRREGEAEIKATIKNLVTQRLPARYGVDPLADIQVLSAMKKATNPLGCPQLNEVLQAALNKNPPVGKLRFRRGDKVIQTKNDYSRDIINGDIGIILDIDRSAKEIEVQFSTPDRFVKVPMLDNELELAYAITVHKFQGSEAPIVVIPIHKCLSQFVTQRNWAYTSVSRAQKVCVLVGQLEEVKKIIGRNRQQKRWTRLEKMLIDKAIKPLAPATIIDNRAKCPKCKMMKHLAHYSPFHEKNICAECFTETETWDW